MLRKLPPVILLLWLTACTLPPSQEVPLPFTTVAMGDQSRFRTPNAVVVRSPAAWTRLWRRHGGDPALQPKIDFERDMVIAVFMGERPTGGYRLRILGVLKTARVLRVEIHRHRPQADELVTQVLTRPFVMIRLAASDLPVAFHYRD